ncbi:hypothetical protein K440DRAFT_638247 [Wilcoxina mikolae CBS 423.85]|nr:hypothetical protein K440DRAFT_638247 [Wilcoxina mikolae CBS 423.85]
MEIDSSGIPHCECGTFDIDDYGCCNFCGMACDLAALTGPDSSSTGPGSSSSGPAPPLKAPTDDFAEYTNRKFTSPTFQLLIGPEKKPFNLHKKVLQHKCPYFATLFGTRIPTREIAENSVTLDSPVDTEDAWRMCIQFLYLGSYTVDVDRKWTECVVNAGVYVLAQKLCMEDMKEVALGKMAGSLVGIYDGSEPSGEEVAQLVEVVYGGTGDQEEGDEMTERCVEEETQKGDEGSTGERGKSRVEQHSKVNLPPDPMRTLIALYAASRVSTLRKDKQFIDVVRFWGDFAADLMSRNLDGDSKTIERHYFSAPEKDAQE